MTRNRFWLPLAALALLTGACSQPHDTAVVERPAVSGVTVQRVVLTEVPESYQTTGSVVPRSSSAVSARVMGTVTALKVKEGDRVRAGELLLTIDDRDLQEKVRAAEEAHSEAVHALESARKQADLAEKTYQRYRKLHEERAITTQELDNVSTQATQAAHGVQRAEAMVKRAAASLEEARIFLGFSRVTSPMDGIVTRKMTDAGSMTSPGVPLLQLEDRQSRLVEAAFEERMLELIKVGSEVVVKVPPSADETAGQVVEVVPTVDPRTRTFIVKIQVPGVELRSGQYGTVRFTSGKRQLILVPAGAVVRRGQLTGVYRVGEGGVVTYRLIRAGRPYGDKVEVLSGLTAGDDVIVEHLDRAVDGGILTDGAAGGEK